MALKVNSNFCIDIGNLVIAIGTGLSQPTDEKTIIPMIGQNANRVHKLFIKMFAIKFAQAILNLPPLVILC
jgi:hypothetical protein